MNFRSFWFFVAIFSHLIAGKVIYDENFLRFYTISTISPNGIHLYIACGPFFDQVGSMISVFRIESESCKPSFVGAISDAAVEELQYPRAIQVSPNGRFVYCLGQGKDAILCFRRDTATGMLALTSMVARGNAGVVGMTGVRSFCQDKAAGRLVVASTDTLSWFYFDTEQGTLTESGFLADSANTKGLHNAVLAFNGSADSGHVYVLSFNPCRIAWFSWHTNTYLFSGCIVDTVAGDGGDASPRAAVVSPDGRHVYIAIEGKNARITWFSIKPNSGALSYGGSMRMADTSQVYVLQSPRSLAITKDGSLVLAGDEFTDRIVVFARNSTTGELAISNTVVLNQGGEESFAPPVSSICFSPTSPCVFVSGANSLSWFTAEMLVSANRALRTSTRCANPFGISAKIATDIRGRNVSASTPPQGVYLSGATHGRLILRKAFVR